MSGEQFRRNSTTFITTTLERQTCMVGFISPNMRANGRCKQIGMEEHPIIQVSKLSQWPSMFI